MIADVAVIGAGIAGAIAAFRLAKNGMVPLWVGPHQNESFKPGEHLSPAALPMLHDLGMSEILNAAVHRRAHSTYSAWGSDILMDRNAILHLEGPPVVLDRVAFEAALTQRAIAAGADHIDASVQSVSVHEDVWHLQTVNGSHRARFVLDATGRKAIIASKLSTRFQADKLSCLYAVFQPQDVENAKPVTLIETDPHGWWYLSKLSNGQVVVNFYTDADLAPWPADHFVTKAQSSNVVGAYLSDFGCTLSSDVKRVTTNTSWIAPAIGPGWAAIGDASAAFDPLSSHGITTAIWTATQAADAFLARDKAAMTAYSDAVAKGVQDFLAARERVYALEQRWPDSAFWKRRHLPATG